MRWRCEGSCQAFSRLFHGVHPVVPCFCRPFGVSAFCFAFAQVVQWAESVFFLFGLLGKCTHAMIPVRCCCGNVGIIGRRTFSTLLLPGFLGWRLCSDAWCLLVLGFGSFVVFFFFQSSGRAFQGWWSSKSTF